MIRKSSNSRQFDTHEDPTSEKGHEDHDEPDERQHDAALGSERLVTPVEYDESECTDDEHEAGRQALHDVLAVYPVRHYGHLQRKQSSEIFPITFY